MEKEKDRKKDEKQQEEQTESLKEVAKRLNEKHERDKKFLKHQVKEMDVLKSIAGVLMDIRHQLAIDALNRKRQLKAADKDADTGRMGAAEGIVLKEDRLGKLMKVMVGIIAGVTGVIAGLITGFTMFIKDIGMVAKGIKNLAKKSETLKKIIVPIEKFFQRIRVNFKLFARNLSRLSKDTSKLGKVMEPIRKTFAGIGKSIRGFAATAKNSGRTIGKIARYLGNFAKQFGKIFGIFKTIGKFVGRFFVPITAIMLIFDSLSESFNLFSDDTKSMSEKIVGLLLVIPKVIGKFFTDFIDSIKNGISWLLKKVFGEDNVVSQFLDKFNFTEIWSGFIEGLTQWITHFPTKFKELTASIKEWWDKFSFGEVLSSITGFFGSMFDKIKGWFSFGSKESEVDGEEEATTGKLSEVFSNIITSIKEKLLAVWESMKAWFSGFDLWPSIKAGAEKISDIGIAIKDAIVGAFNKVLSFFTGDTSIGETISNWWTGFKEDPLGGVLALAMAPLNMLRGAFKSILSFFTGDKAEENAAADEESSNLFDTIMTSIKNTVKSVFTSVFDFFTGLFSFDAILDYVPDVGGLLGKAGDWLTGLIDGAIEWIKDKLSFFGGKSDEEKEAEKAAKEAEKQRKAEEREAKQKKDAAMEKRKKEIEQQIKAQYGEDSLNWGWGRGDAEAKELRDKMIADAEAQYDQDGELKPIKTPGNLGTALSPNLSGSTYSASDFATSPIPVQIVGTGQEMGLAGDDLAASQAIMEENRSINESKGSSVNAVMAPTTNISNSSSVTNVAGSMPSTRDYADYTQAFRPMGNSR